MIDLFHDIFELIFFYGVTFSLSTIITCNVIIFICLFISLKNNKRNIQQVAIWRREIACEKLDPHLPEVIECLGLNVDRIRPLLTNLVSSLNLQEDLHLRALQWQLLTLLLLKLLSVRYPVVHAAFNDPKIVTRELLPRLAIFQLDVGYLDRILAHLTQADAILKAFYDCGPPQNDQVTSLDLD